jgi:hypothetical protein
MKLKAITAPDIQPRAVGRIAWWPDYLPALLALCAGLLWVVSLWQIEPRQMTDVGLASVLPLTTYLAFGVLSASFCLLVQRSESKVGLLLLHVVLLIVMIHGLPTLLYDNLRYAWAWKHVGLVEYIQRNGHVDPKIEYLGAYHNWPGFFVLAALFTDVAGLESALQFAAWGPVFFNLLFLGALLLIFQPLTTDRRLIWLSIWFFFLGDWVGQDYFAPQALTYFLYLVIIGICLRWFSITTVPDRKILKRWLRFELLVGLADRMLRGASRGATSEEPGPIQSLGLRLTMMLALVVVIASHQLTPFMLLVSLGALVVFQRINARNLPLLMGVLTATWISYMAIAFLNGNIRWIIQSIGQITNNLDARQRPFAPSAGQELVASVDRVFTYLLWLAALLGGLRRLRNGYWDVAAAVLLMAPFFLLPANAYGGEMLYRIKFFALPFVSFFAAALIFPTVRTGTRRWTPPLIGLASAALLVGVFFSYYGRERLNYFTKDELAAAEYFYDHAPRNSLVIQGSFNYPSLFKHYEYYTYESLVPPPRRQLPVFQASPLQYIRRIVTAQPHATTYVIITRSQKAHNDMYGLAPPGSLDKVEQMLRASDKFQIVYSNDDAVIFRLEGTLETAQR